MPATSGRIDFLTGGRHDSGWRGKLAQSWRAVFNDLHSALPRDYLMDDAVGKKPCGIVAPSGWEMLSKDQRRLEDLLRDGCLDSRDEVRVLMSAVRENVVVYLAAADR